MYSPLPVHLFCMAYIENKKNCTCAARDRATGLEGAVLRLRGPDNAMVFFWNNDLAKLNLKCYTSYSIIFYRNTFYPESSASIGSVITLSSCFIMSSLFV